MNKLYIGIMLLGLLNIAILAVGIVIMQKFKDFEKLSKIFCEIAGRHGEMHKLILKQYQDMAERYDSQEALFDKMRKQYEVITDQYKMISRSQDEYRELCKECVIRYGDAYDQFKLCSDKLDRIFPPQVSVSTEDFEADNEDIVI